MSKDNKNYNSIAWPKPTGLLAKLDSPSELYRKWENINIKDFKKLMGACLHDHYFYKDTIIIEVTLSKNLRKFKSIQIINHRSTFTNIHAYHFDDIEELITNEVSKNRVKHCTYQIACQLYGDIWMLEKKIQT